MHCSVRQLRHACLEYIASQKRVCKQTSLIWCCHIGIRRSCEKCAYEAACKSIDSKITSCGLYTLLFNSHNMHVQSGQDSIAAKIHGRCQKCRFNSFWGFRGTQPLDCNLRKSHTMVQEGSCGACRSGSAQQAWREALLEVCAPQQQVCFV